MSEITNKSQRVNSLPEHLWAEVLLFLSDEDLPAVREVSHTLSKLCENLEQDICSQSERALVLNHLRSTYSNAGYRDGMDETEDKLLQVGFNQGFAKGALSAFELGVARGATTAAVLFANLFGTSIEQNSTPTQHSSRSQPPLVSVPPTLPTETAVEQKLSATISTRLRRNRPVYRQVAITIDDDEDFGLVSSPSAPASAPAATETTSDLPPSSTQPSTKSTSQPAAAQPPAPSAVSPSLLAHLNSHPHALPLTLLLCASLTAHAKQLDLPAHMHTHSAMLTDAQWRTVAALCSVPGDAAESQGTEGAEGAKPVGACGADLDAAVAAAVYAANRTSSSRPGVPAAQLTAVCSRSDADPPALAAAPTAIPAAASQAEQDEPELNPYALKLSAPAALHAYARRLLQRFSAGTDAATLNALYRKGIAALRKHNQVAQRDMETFKREIARGRECFHEDHFHGETQVGDRFVPEEESSEHNGEFDADVDFM